MSGPRPRHQSLDQCNTHLSHFMTFTLFNQSVKSCTTSFWTDATCMELLHLQCLFDYFCPPHCSSSCLFSRGTTMKLEHSCRDFRHPLKYKLTCWRGFNKHQCTFCSSVCVGVCARACVSRLTWKMASSQPTTLSLHCLLKVSGVLSCELKLTSGMNEWMNEFFIWII